MAGGFLDLINQSDPLGGSGGFLSGLMRALMMTQSPAINDINSGGYGSVIQGGNATPADNAAAASTGGSPVLYQDISGMPSAPPPGPSLGSAVVPMPRARPSSRRVAPPPEAAQQGANEQLSMSMPLPSEQQAAPVSAPMPSDASPLYPELLTGGPGFLGHLGAGIMGLTHSGGLIPGVMNMVGGLMTGQRMDPQGIGMEMANREYQGLRQQGLSDGQAIAALQNPALMTQFVGNPTSPGSIELPGGLKIPYLSHGGQTTLAVPQGASLGGLAGLGQQMLQGNAQAESIGKTQGTVAAGLPNASLALDRTLGLIDSISGDPNLTLALGPVAGHMPALVGPQAEAVAKIDQLKGMLTTSVMQSMRGSGIRLTQNEINMLQQGAARLERAQTPQDFQSALADVRANIASLRSRLGQMAGGQATPSAVGQAPVYAVNPKTGQRIYFDAARNSWVPVQ